MTIEQLQAENAKLRDMVKKAQWASGTYCEGWNWNRTDNIQAAQPCYKSAGPIHWRHIKELMR